MLSASTRRVDIAGCRTVAAAEATLAAIRDALREADEVLLDCTSLADCDLTLVQLMVSARRTARRQGKTLRLAAPAAGALADVLVSLGVAHRAIDGGIDCADGFWRGREKT